MAQFQQCCVHISRDIAHKIRINDTKKICDDFKGVHQEDQKKKQRNKSIF